MLPRSRSLTLLAVPASALALAGCGSSSSSTAGAGDAATTASRANRGAAFSDPAVAKCLEQQGVTVPQRPQGRGTPPGNGAPGAGSVPPQGGTPSQGTPPQGTTNPQGAPPSGGGRRPRGGLDAATRAALEKCGVQLRAPSQRGASTTSGAQQ